MNSVTEWWPGGERVMNVTVAGPVGGCSYDGAMIRRGHVSHLQVGGVRAEVTYKDVKNLRLRVVPPDGTVKISVPWGISQETVEEFVRSRAEWLAKARQQVRAANPVQGPLVDGGRARLWGRWHEIRIEPGKRAGGRVEDGRIVLAGPDEAARARGLENLYRRELREAVEELFEEWEPRVGERHAVLKLRRMTSRWGTCNVRTASITINTALAQWPRWAVEYVVVHELMHLVEPGHGPRFVAGMDGLLPDWRQRRRALRGAP